MLKLIAGQHVCIIKVLSVMAVVIAIDILGTYLQLMAFAKRSEPICLKRMFCKAFTLYHHAATIGEGHIHQFCIGILLIGMLTREGEHVRESEPLALPPRLMFIVQSSIP